MADGGRYSCGSASRATRAFLAQGELLTACRRRRRTQASDAAAAEAGRYADMTNTSVNLLSFALIFVAAFLNPAAAQPRGSGPIAIVDASRTDVATTPM